MDMATSRVTPAEALKAGRWPGLPELDSTSTRTSDFPAPDPAAAISPDVIEIDPQLLNGSFAGLVEAFETLPDERQQAALAVAIGERLIECWPYQALSDDELGLAAERALARDLDLRQDLLAHIGPDGAERAIDVLANIDQAQWIDKWLVARLGLRRRCGGVDGIADNNRLPQAVDWWRRAGEMGHLDGLNRWIGMAFLVAIDGAGSAVRAVELKPRVIDAVETLLRAHYAPVLGQLKTFSELGYFTLPNPRHAWIYGEALSRIISAGGAASWRFDSTWSDPELHGRLRRELDRIASEMTPAEQREAEVWVRAIIELPNQ